MSEQKVYLVTQWRPGGTRFIGVYSTRERAEAEAEQITDPWREWYGYVHECPFDQDGKERGGRQ
jgi:hypothetical protein